MAMCYQLTPLSFKELTDFYKTRICSNCTLVGFVVRTNTVTSVEAFLRSLFIL